MPRHRGELAARMTDGTDAPTRREAQSGKGMMLRNGAPSLPYARLAATAARAGALLGAATCTAVGWLLLDDRWDNFDLTIRWYGASTLLLLVAATPLPRYEHMRTLSVRIAAFWKRHWWEILAFGGVFALGIFMRVYQFGHFPPSDGVAFEEAQAGGAGYAILNHGTRPIEFAVTNYTAALGFFLFGYDITALRLPFLIVGILSLVPFYLLLRLLVSAPAALFVLALFAVNRWHAFTSGIADETFLGSGLVIVAALLLLVVLRTSNPLALVGLGLTTGGLVYEYTAYRHVPFLIVAMLISVVVLWAGTEVWLRRTSAMTVLATAGRKSWLMVVFAVALAMAVSPLIVSSLNGNRIFTEAFGRHGAEQAQTGPFGLLPEGWPTRLRLLTEVFLPFGPREYPDIPPLNLPGERMLDPVTASLALIAMAYAFLTIHRPHRLFFVVWLFAGLSIGAVIPVRFLVPKFTGLLPALFVLIAFLVDDVIRLIRRRIPVPAPQIVLIPLAPLVLWAFVVNFGTFRKQGNDALVIREFNSPLVNLCNFAADLGRDNYVYVWSETGVTEGLFGHSDFDWVCRDIAGQSLNSMWEVSPLQPRPYENVAFVYLNVSDPEPDPMHLLMQVYPTITGPTRVRRAFDSYTLEAFVVPQADIVQQQGLYGACYSDEVRPGPPIAHRLDPGDLFVHGREIIWPTGSTRVRWEGLVLSKREGKIALVPQTEMSLEIRLDGQLVYEADGARERVTPAGLPAGWHVLQMELARTEANRAPKLAWVTAGSDESFQVEESDFFADSAVRGWSHVRYIQFGAEELSWQRVDPFPVFGWGDVRPPDWLFGDDSSPSGRVGLLLREEWRTNWQVPEVGLYRLKLSARSGTGALSVDGTLLVTAASEPGQLATEENQVLLEPGEHRLELVFVNPGPGSAGVTLEIEGPGDGEGYFVPF